MREPPPAAAQVIRTFLPEDRESVVRFLSDSDPWKRLNYTAADWNRIFTPLPQGRDGYAIELDRAGAGMGLVRQKFLMGDYLKWLAAAPWAQGRGLGASLLAHLERIVFARTKNVFACVSDFNEGARRFYRKHGYQEIGPMSNFLIPGSAKILLRKTVGLGENSRAMRQSSYANREEQTARVIGLLASALV